MKRLTAILVAILASSLFVHAQQPQTTATTAAVQQAERAPVPAAVGPVSLVGLTKPQVEANFCKPSVALATLWNYKQPQGTLHVRFSREGIVSAAETDVEGPPGGKGYTNVNGQHIPSPRSADSPPAGASAKCRDGSYSFSANRRGTCSHHGGVASWL